LGDESFAVSGVGLDHLWIVGEPGRTNEHEAQLLAYAIMRVLFYFEVCRMFRLIVVCWCFLFIYFLSLL